MKPFLLYGSYGYTGSLIASLAVEKGLRPVLGGRNEARLRAQADALDLPYRVFPLEDTPALHAALNETAGVLHCAGPFVHTYDRMAQACLATGRHYLDISGEIPAFEALAKMDRAARLAGVMLLPGAGFDVVPSDCLAMHLKRRLPTATHLRLYIRSVGGGVSRGTARSAIENLHRGGMIRRDGALQPVPPAWSVRRVDFGRGPVRAVSIGWGDVSTAFHSTGIPNVETYMALPGAAIAALRLLRAIGPPATSPPVKALLKAGLRLMPRGPAGEQRRKAFSLIAGEAHDQEGHTCASRLKVPEGYTLTALAGVEIVQRVLSGEFKPGFQTPSLAYGADFILQFYRAERYDL